MWAGRKRRIRLGLFSRGEWTSKSSGAHVQNLLSGPCMDAGIVLNNQLVLWSRTCVRPDYQR